MPPESENEKEKLERLREAMYSRTISEKLHPRERRLLDTERSPQSAMSDWLASGEAPANFTIDRDCELRAITDEKAAVRYVRHPL